MRLAPEGAPQMLLTTLVLGGGVWGASALPAVGFWVVAIALALIWCWSIAFFRDPKRVATFDANVLCSPADGTILDIDRLDRYDPIEGPAIRIGIFLSLFNVHINRSPCNGTVQAVVYRKGKFVAAMKPEASDVNESNTLVMDPAAPLVGPVVTRQITGLAARRIVCHARVGQSLTTGERYGLIKYGSRTELIVPDVDGTEVLVKIGDKVLAGLTPFVRMPVRTVGAATVSKETAKVGG